MADYDAKIRVNTSVDTSQMQRLQLQIDKATDKVAELAKKYDEVRNMKIPTDGYTELEKKLQTAKAELSILIEEEKRFADAGMAIGAPWDNILAKEAVARERIEAIQASMQKLVDTGKAFKIGKDQNKIASVGKEYARAQSELRVLNTKQEELSAKQYKTAGAAKSISGGFKKMGAVARKAFSLITNGSQKSNGLLSTMATRLKGIALSLLVFNWVTRGFNAMVSSMKKGFQNLAVHSSEFNKTMSDLKSQTETLKNSLATAFEPIASVIIPYLTQFVSWLNTACDSLARFRVALSGKSTYTKAKKQFVDYADSIGMVKDSAEEAKGSLAGFDKLNVLGKQEEKNTGGSGNKVQFEEQEVGTLPDFLQEMKDAIQNGNWFSVGTLLAQKVNESLQNIDWRGIQEKCISVAHGIAEFLSGYIASADWNLVGTTLANGLNTAVITGFVFLSTFDWGGAAMALSDSINGFFSEVDWALVGVTITTGLMGLLEYARTAIQEIDWMAIGDDIATLLKNIDWVALLKEVGGLIVDAIVAGLEVMDNLVDKLFENEAAFEILAVAVGTVIALLIAWTISSGAGAAATAALGAAFNLLTSPITLIILAIGAIIAIIVLLVKNWDTVAEVARNVWDSIKSIWDSFAKWFDTKVWEPFKKGLKAVGNFFIGIWNGIVSAIESAINWIISGINMALDAINKFISGASKLLSYVGIDINFQIPTLKKVSLGRIPQLANGAVIKGGHPFAAILGDQPAGQTNIETPLSTMVDAFKQAMSDAGMQGGGNYTFVAELNGREIFKETIRQEQMNRKATGRKAFA